MVVELLDLVGTALRVAKQALGKQARKLDSDRLSRVTHIVAHCIRKEEIYSYVELVYQLNLMVEICYQFGHHPNELLDPTRSIIT